MKDQGCLPSDTPGTLRRILPGMLYPALLPPPNIQVRTGGGKDYTQRKHMTVTYVQKPGTKLLVINNQGPPRRWRKINIRGKHERSK